MHAFVACYQARHFQFTSLQPISVVKNLIACLACQAGAVFFACRLCLFTTGRCRNQRFHFLTNIHNHTLLLPSTYLIRALKYCAPGQLRVPLLFDEEAPLNVLQTPVCIREAGSASRLLRTYLHIIPDILNSGFSDSRTWIR